MSVHVYLKIEPSHRKLGIVFAPSNIETVTGKRCLPCGDWPESGVVILEGAEVGDIDIIRKELGYQVTHLDPPPREFVL